MRVQQRRLEIGAFVAAVAAIAVAIAIVFLSGTAGPLALSSAVPSAPTASSIG